MICTQSKEFATRRQHLDCYFSDVSQTACFLSRRETRQELAQRIQAGDYEAREEMVRANLRLVVKIARSAYRIRPRGGSLADRIAEGNLGLVHAVEYFDPEVGVQFRNLFTILIKQSIDRLIKNSGKSIRIPSYMHQMVRNWNAATCKNSNHKELDRTPTHEETSRTGLDSHPPGSRTSSRPFGFSTPVLNRKARRLPRPWPICWSIIDLPTARRSQKPRNK